MRIGLLGSLEVVSGGTVVWVGGARLRALLVRLALDPGRVVGVAALSEALSPAGGPKDPAHAVQSLVSRLRQALPETVPVESVIGGYRLDVSADSFDVHRFEALAREGRHALRAGQAELASRLLRQALAL